MATLSELAKTQQTTTVGGAQSGAVGSAGGTSIQPTQIIDKSAGLAKDIGKMFGGLLQEHQQASEYAGKRVGTDNLASYKAEMDKINEYYNSKENLTSADYVEKSRQEQGVYESLLQTGAFPDNQLANQAFKDTFASPAGEFTLRQRAINDKLGFDLHTKEELASVKDEMQRASGVYTIDNINTWKARVSAVNEDPNKVWDEASIGLNQAFYNDFKDGVNSPTLKGYLENGKLTQNSLDAIYNNYFGKFSKRTNGSFSKVYEDMPNKTQSELVKSFSSWLTSMNKHAPTKVMETVSLTNSSTKSTDASTSIQNKIDASFNQIQDLYSIVSSTGDSSAVTKYTKALQSFQELEVKHSQSKLYEDRFNTFINGDYSQLTDNEFTYDIYNPNNLSVTQGGGTIKASDMASYIGEKTLSLYNDAVQNGDGAKASSALYALGRLEMQGYSTKESSFVDKTLSSPNKFINQADNDTTIEQFMARLDSSVGYKNITHMDAPHLSKVIRDNVANYYKDQKTLLDKGGKDANGKDLTEDGILKNTKLFYRTESKRVTSALAENQRLVAGKILGLTKEEALGDGMDKFVHGEVFGYKVGESVFANGSLNSMISGCVENGSSDRSSLGSCMKSKAIILDKSYLPFIGTSLVLNNPTSLSQTKFKTNITDIIKYNIGQFQSTKNVDFGDAVDSSNISISQNRVYIGGKVDRQEVLTTVHIKDKGGRILHSVLITPEELKAGIPSALKAKFPNNFGLDKNPSIKGGGNRGGHSGRN